MDKGQMNPSATGCVCMPTIHPKPRLLQLFNAAGRSGREKKAMCCMFFVIAQRFLDQMATQHRKQEHAP